MKYDQRLQDERAAKESALMIHLGIADPNPHRDWRQHYDVSLQSLAQESAMARGERRPDWDTAVAREIQAWRTNGTSDFVGILENIATKKLLQGHDSAPVVHPYLTRPGSVPNFNPAGRVALNQFDVPEISEHGEVSRPAISDRRAMVQAENFGAIISVAREVLEGDDPGAFGRVAEYAGRASALKKDYVWIDGLTSASGAGPTMDEDGVALFNVATHGNYVASGGGAPSVTTMAAAFGAMRTRTDADTGKAQNITPRYLLVPAALEPVARVLAASWNTTLADSDGDLKVLVSGYLDSISTTRWYLFADPIRFDTWEMSYIQGTDKPDLESKRSFTTDAIEMRVRHAFGVAPLDWRTQFANVGA